MTNENKTIKELVEEYNTYKKEFNKSFKEKIKPFLTGLCNSTVLSYKVYFYTPHFMDGDTCEYGIWGINIKTPNSGDASGDYEDGYLCEYDTLDKNETKELNKLEKEIKKIPLELIKECFGDHMVMIVTNKTVNIEEHDHD